MDERIPVAKRRDESEKLELVEILNFSNFFVEVPLNLQIQFIYSQIFHPLQTLVQSPSTAHLRSGQGVWLLSNQFKILDPTTAPMGSFLSAEFAATTLEKSEDVCQEL